MKKVLALLLIVAITLTMAACGSVKNTNDDNHDSTVSSDVATNTSNDKPTEESVQQENIQDENTQDNTANTNDNDDVAEESNVVAVGIRSDFKAAMDAYEAFYDEYCDILQKYYANPTDLSLLAQYSSLMGKAVEMDDAFTKWESEDLTTEELKYYLEVNNRVMQKLVSIIG